MSRLLTNRQWVEQREVALLALPEAVDLYRSTWTKTTNGGTLRTLTKTSVGPGRLGPMGSESEQVIAEKWAKVQPWVITLLPDRDVVLGDQLRISGRQFEVIGFDTVRSYPMTQRVVVREITNG